MQRALIALSALLAVAAVTASAVLAGKPSGGADLTPYYPDLQTVVPLQLQLVNQQQRDELRFSNGIANTGGGPWALRPDPPPAQATTTTTAVQEIRDSAAPDRCGTQPKPSDPCYHVLKENVA